MLFYRKFGSPRAQLRSERVAGPAEGGVNVAWQAARMITRVGGEPVIAVGIPLPQVDASYYSSPA